MDDEFSSAEQDVLRFATFLLYIGCARSESKRSKVFVYSFVSGEELLSNFDSLQFFRPADAIPLEKREAAIRMLCVSR